MHANFIWALRIIYLLCPILFLAQLSAQDTDVPFNPENMDNSSVPATPKSLRIPNWPAQLGTTKTEVKIGTRINEEHGNSKWHPDSPAQSLHNRRLDSKQPRIAYQKVENNRFL